MAVTVQHARLASSNKADSSDSRLISIDVFRGLVMAVMVWVNDMGRVRDIPAWLKHAPATQDAMTFVDLVFPAFLFIVGMSIPFAITHRRQQGQPRWRLAQHILGRTVSLLLIGVCMVNMPNLLPQQTGMSRPLWSLLVYLAVILVWMRLPKIKSENSWLEVGMRMAGIALLFYLAIVYRGQEDGQVVWLKTRWWGILGLIGWAYLVAAVLFLLIDNRPSYLLLAWIMLMLLSLAGWAGRLDWAETINRWVSLKNHLLGHGFIAMTGLLAMVPWWDKSLGKTLPQRIGWLLALAAITALGGLLLRPVWGLSKNGATPTWCLYCPAICCVIFAALHVVIDVFRCVRWCRMFEIVGRSALLAYILSYLLYAVLDTLDITWLQTHMGTGALGILRAAAWSGLVVILTVLLSRCKLTLRL